jgi:hypothetical protein
MLFLFISMVIFGIIIWFMPKRISLLEMYTTSPLFVVFWIYPAVNIMFLNFYPQQKNRMIKTLYFTGWSAFALAYEWLATKTGLFHHNGWNLIYSIPIYPFLYLLLLINWKLINKLNSASTKPKC